MIGFHRLLGYRLKALWNGTLSTQARHRGLNWAMLVFVIPPSLLFFWGAGATMGIEARSMPNGPELMSWLLIGLLAAEFLLMLMGEVGGFANLIFFSARGEWLRRAPITGRRYLYYQIVEGVLVMAAVPTFFLFTIYLSLILGYDASPAALVVGVVTFGLVRLMPLGLSLVMVWALIPRTDRETFRWLDAAFGILFGIFMLALWRLHYQPDTLPRLLEGAFVPEVPKVLVVLFPPAAVGRIVAAVLEGRTFPLETVVLVVTQTALLIGLPLALAGRMIDEGRFPEPAPSAIPKARSWLRGPSGPLAAMVRKDLLVFIREGRLGLRLISSGVVTFLFLWFLVSSAPVGPAAPALLLVFILSSEAGTLVVPSEGKAVVWPAVAPISPFRFILGKMIAALLLCFGLSAGFFAFLAAVQHWSPGALARLLLLSPPVALFGASMGVFLASRWGRFDWDDPRRMLHPAAQIFHALVMGLGFVVTVALTGIDTEADPSLGRAVTATAVVLCLGFMTVALADAVRTARRREWTL
jgi:hypothetical protein